MYPTFIANLMICFHEPVQTSSKGVKFFLTFADGRLTSHDIKKAEEALILAWDDISVVI